MDKIKPLSWSELDCFETDRDKWYARYIVGIKDPPTPAMQRGTDLHEMLGTTDSQMMKDVMAEQAKRYSPDEIRCHEKILSTFQSTLLVELPGIRFEKPVTCIVEDVPTVGYWDGFDESGNRDERHTIIEIKTGSILWTEERASQHGQLAFYASQWLEMYTDKIRLPLFVLFSASTKNGRCVTHNIEIDREQIAQMRYRIKKASTDMGNLWRCRISSKV